MSYYRACRRHLDEITSRDGSQGEVLECPQGHTVHSWYVMDEKGEIVATAFEYETFILVPGSGSNEEGEELREPSEEVSRAPEDWEELQIRWT